MCFLILDICNPLNIITGIKQILPHHMETTGPVLGEERSSNEFFDPLDHTIDVHGHIIGMGLSPDHRSVPRSVCTMVSQVPVSDCRESCPASGELDTTQLTGVSTTVIDLIVDYAAFQVLVCKQSCLAQGLHHQ